MLLYPTHFILFSGMGRLCWALNRDPPTDSIDEKLLWHPNHLSYYPPYVIRILLFPSFQSPWLVWLLLLVLYLRNSVSLSSSPPTPSIISWDQDQPCHETKQIETAEVEYSQHLVSLGSKWCWESPAIGSLLQKHSIWMMWDREDCLEVSDERSEFRRTMGNRQLL